jgi:hypothetical protein
MTGNVIMGFIVTLKEVVAYPFQRSTYYNVMISFEEDDIPDVLKPPEDCKGSYLQTQGYRKVSGDYCMGGVELGPIRLECPKNETTEKQKEPNE